MMITELPGSIAPLFDVAGTQAALTESAPADDVAGDLAALLAIGGGVELVEVVATEVTDDDGVAFPVGTKVADHRLIREVAAGRMRELPEYAVLAVEGDLRKVVNLGEFGIPFRISIAHLIQTTPAYQAITD